MSNNEVRPWMIQKVEKKIDEVMSALIELGEEIARVKKAHQTSPLVTCPVCGGKASHFGRRNERKTYRCEQAVGLCGRVSVVPHNVVSSFSATYFDTLDSCIMSLDKAASKCFFFAGGEQVSRDSYYARFAQ